MNVTNKHYINTFDKGNTEQLILMKNGKVILIHITPESLFAIVYVLEFIYMKAYGTTE